jgi:CheY-like chemotaxis protein
MSGRFDFRRTGSRSGVRGRRTDGGSLARSVGQTTNRAVRVRPVGLQVSSRSAEKSCVLHRDREFVPLAQVLIVEDDPDMQALERLALEYEGYEVATANDGIEALSKLRDGSPSLILLDLMMPRMDGLTFLAERDRQGLGRDVPVVCITAAGPEMVKQAQRLGACAFLAKPADFHALSAVVAEYCGLPRSER